MAGHGGQVSHDRIPDRLTVEHLHPDGRGARHGFRRLQAHDRFVAAPGIVDPPGLPRRISTDQLGVRQQPDGLVRPLDPPGDRLDPFVVPLPVGPVQQTPQGRWVLGLQFEHAVEIAHGIPIALRIVGLPGAVVQRGHLVRTVPSEDGGTNEPLAGDSELVFTQRDAVHEGLPLGDQFRRRPAVGRLHGAVGKGQFERGQSVAIDQEADERPAQRVTARGRGRPESRHAQQVLQGRRKAEFAHGPAPLVRVHGGVLPVHRLGQAFVEPDPVAASEKPVPESGGHNVHQFMLQHRMGKRRVVEVHFIRPGAFDGRMPGAHEPFLLVRAPIDVRRDTCRRGRHVQVGNDPVKLVLVIPGDEIDVPGRNGV